ncbi:DUF4214 domain-containing protein [Paucibacter sp. TC2R-5]|uniref:DUF4214 domain-containing protein n=1 Tax=Paucibacter sp. TC2R-5 TaxID=2893555 RepID=UPI0021E45257|nr:DUF4214 domain-containing protein [Paucibacter sp. TC2R-5]MCV2361774.1 DUF4214 domain-containing protein [Paucibacter sp. TC2R-5]
MSEQASKTSAGGRVNSVSALLALEDENFVRSAYLSVLGREVDADGLSNYLGQIRAGAERGELTVVLALSQEGRQHSANVEGLAELVARLRPHPKPAWKRALRRLLLRPDVSMVAQLERQLRATDNRLYRIGQNLETLLAAHHAEIVALRHDVAQLPLRTEQASVPESPSGVAPVHHIRIVPMQAERIYQDLRRAQSRRVGFQA